MNLSRSGRVKNVKHESERCHFSFFILRERGEQNESQTDTPCHWQLQRNYTYSKLVLWQVNTSTTKPKPFITFHTRLVFDRAITPPWLCTALKSPPGWKMRMRSCHAAIEFPTRFGRSHYQVDERLVNILLFLNEGQKPLMNQLAKRDWLRYSSSSLLKDLQTRCRCQNKLLRWQSVTLQRRSKD